MFLYDTKQLVYELVFFYFEVLVKRNTKCHRKKKKTNWPKK